MQPQNSQTSPAVTQSSLASIATSTPLRNVRPGRSYLHGVALDATYPFPVDAAARRLLGLQSSALRMLHDANSIPAALHYLLPLAYDYDGPRAIDEPNATRPRHSPDLQVQPGPTSLPPRVTNADRSSAAHESPARVDSSIVHASANPPASAVRPPRTDADTSLPQVAPQPAPPSRRAFSLAELGRALEAHNFPSPARSAPATEQHDRLPSIEEKSARDERRAETRPRSAAQTAAPQSPIARIAIPPALDESTPPQSSPGANSAHQRTSFVPPNLDRTRVEPSRVEDAGFVRATASREQLRVMPPSGARRASMDASLNPSPLPAAAADPRAFTALKRKALRTESSDRNASPDRSAERAQPHRPKQQSQYQPRNPFGRVQVRTVSARPRIAQRVPVAFLERSRLAHMHLRLFR